MNLVHPDLNVYVQDWNMNIYVMDNNIGMIIVFIYNIYLS